MRERERKLREILNHPEAEIKLKPNKNSFLLNHSACAKKKHKIENVRKHKRKNDFSFFSFSLDFFSFFLLFSLFVQKNKKRMRKRERGS